VTYNSKLDAMTGLGGRLKIKIFNRQVFRKTCGLRKEYGNKMLRGLYTAYTGMLNEQYRMDIMSNNLANADTTGYKKEGSTSQAYDEVMAVKIKDLSENPNVPQRLGNMSLGVKIGETFTDFSQGSLRITENPYDLAIGGEGFFNIEFTSKAGETSTKYTRDGGFTLTKDGWLVTKDGDYVLGENGRIQVSTTAAETVIDRMGNIYQDGDLVASIKITEFEDTNYLTHYGETMWDAKEGAESHDAEDASIYQGYLEMSNANVVKEMVNMITISRQYEANQKMITTFDDTLEQSMQLIRI
jgi:flagellar basal-body rod protein FlgF